MAADPNLRRARRLATGRRHPGAHAGRPGDHRAPRRTGRAADGRARNRRRRSAIAASKSHRTASRMSLSKKLKVGLDETRILILGSQILLGFQLQGAFRPTFEQLPFHSRVVWVATLGLITLAVALLITPSVQHRLVEEGHDTKRLLGVIRLCAGLSLAPFALALGADLFLAAEPVLGTGLAASIGIVAGLTALLFWYGLQALTARTTGEQERTMTSAEPEHEHTSLETKIEQMLTEARVMLPGAQALLGLQPRRTWSARG